ncbi:MAG TPA: preprotein translocase subunit SecE [Firmicutes bacterium]|nr:preprotein translocase subunit SecE [Bacillota bacterium]
MAAKSGGNIGKYFRSVIAELKKVSWPNRRETTTYTIVVIVTVLVLGLLVGVFDLILSFLSAKL